VIKDLEILDNQCSKVSEQPSTIPVTVNSESQVESARKLYIESYGCQMNFSDSEIVSSILKKSGYATTSDLASADLIFLNTCSIREKAEQTVKHRLNHFVKLKKNKPNLIVGILGCMAERLKEQLLVEEKIVDLVVGPDAYRSLPALIEEAEDGKKAVNTFLSREETYADISPVRLASNGVAAFVSIMRGCDNMCSFCVVPFTRGRERSRDPYSIVNEATDLFNKGYREITLLGQNVDSYKWSDNPNLKGKARIELAEIDQLKVVTFSDLLEMVARIHPDLRIRFSTSHPKDITDEVLYTMKKYDNICKHIHLPVQSGSSSVLKRMNRTYDRAWYLDRVKSIRRILGDQCALSSDMIAGFSGENESDHQATLSIMDLVKYDFSFMFYYSERPGTLAARNYPDDIPLDIKKRRLNEIISKQQELSLLRNKPILKTTQKVLIEGYSKRSTHYFQGRNSENKVVVFPAISGMPGEYVEVFIEKCTAATLIGKIA